MKRYIFTLIRGIGYGLGFALFSFLLNSCNVKALETTYKPGYTVPLGIRQASLISATEFNKSSYGNVVTDDSMWPTYIRADYSDGYTYQTYGTFITFCPNEGFIKNHTYTLRFITSTGPGSYANNQYYKFGTAWNQPIKLVNNIGSNPITSGVSVKSLSTNSIQYTDVITQDFSYISEFTATFTAPSQNQCISINIDMNGNFNNQYLYFLGYILMDSGIDNSEQLNDINNSVNDVNDSVNDVNNSIKDDSVNQDKANSFFNNFSTNEHGLTGIITAPLSLIQKFNSNTCTPLTFQIKGKTAQLPCGDFLFSREDMQEFLNIYNIIVGGLIAYGACRGIFNRVQDFKNPDNSKVEVIDL